MSKEPNIHREIEIKLDLGSFTNYLKLLGFLGQIEHEELQQNGFFDSDDRNWPNPAGRCGCVPKKSAA